MSDTAISNASDGMSRSHEWYREHLVNHVIDFFLRHALDTEYGGYLTCLDNEGTVVSTDKYFWSQCRGVWTFSAMYNRVAREPRYLDAARLGVEFILSHGRDDQGRWICQTDRTGQNVAMGPVSIYTDMFAAYGLQEYYRATGDSDVLKIACDTYLNACRRMDDPGCDAVWPYELAYGQHAQGMAMVKLDTGTELARVVQDDQIEHYAADAVEWILNIHHDSERGLNLETVNRDGTPIDSPEGRVVMPGHVIEMGWMLMHWAKPRGRFDVLEKAGQLIRRHLEFGWDDTYGGIMLALDADNRQPTSVIPNSDLKAWWPHTEALYALLLVEEQLSVAWSARWYEQLFEWCMKHHVSPHGDWHQRIERDGSPTTRVIALPVKDPYHLPRALMLCRACLARMDGTVTTGDPFESLDRKTMDQL